MNRFYATISICLFAVLSLALNVDEAQACSCLVPPAPAQALEEADAVFLGQVIKIEPGPHRVEVVLSVKQRWKGAEDEQVRVSTASQTAACGFPFQDGEEFLVYAGEDRGQLWVSLCSRTKRVDGAEQEIGELDEERANSVPHCSSGQEIEVESWGCALFFNQEGAIRTIPGVVAPSICRLRGIPVVDGWKCVTPHSQSSH